MEPISFLIFSAYKDTTFSPKWVEKSIMFYIVRAQN